MSPFFEGAHTSLIDPSIEQYQAARLAISFLLRNWAGIAFLCQSRALSELLAVFCCNIHEYSLAKSLLGLLFDVFGLQINEENYKTIAQRKSI